MNTAFRCLFAAPRLVRLTTLCVLSLALTGVQASVRIKDIGRFDGIRDNVVIGYGLVVGLAGTGDSQKSVATVQSVSNMLQEFGLHVPPASVASRNIAAVMVTRACRCGRVNLEDLSDHRQEQARMTLRS